MGGLFSRRKRTAKPKCRPSLDGANIDRRSQSTAQEFCTVEGNNLIFQHSSRSTGTFQHRSRNTSGRDVVYRREEVPLSSAESRSVFRPTEVQGNFNVPEEQFREATRRGQSTVLANPKKLALIVAAIDFGTSNSGYAYSFHDNPHNFLTHYWNGKIKTPTVVLLNPRKQLENFGEAARKQYEQLMEANDHSQWYFFDKFKMKLFAKDSPLNRNIELEDFTGKRLPAIDVFTAAIKYLKDDLIRVLNERKQNVEMNSPKDIHWVLTVPAIWNDLSKLFMRQAAEQAGIPGEMLTLALEPEAASLYCEDQFGSSVIPVGCRYLILDLGGGTADIAFHEKTNKGLKEVTIPTGGDFGGSMIDNKFISILTRLFGSDVISVFKKYNTAEYWQLITDFEVKKSHFNGSSGSNLQFPQTLLDMYENYVGETIQISLKQSPLFHDVQFRNGKLLLSKNIMHELFDSVVDKIQAMVERLMQSHRIDYIILAGGLSESPFVQNAISTRYKESRIPREPSGAVVIGAVLFGHNPKGISSRKCKYTYGIPRLMRFKPYHQSNKKVVIDGVDYCDDLFNKHIEIGQEVSLDSSENTKAIEYFPSTCYMRQAVVEVYASTRRNPMYIDENDCVLVGLIKVDIDPQEDIYSKILVKLVFGGTELVVEVTDTKTGKVTTGSVDFLG